MGLIELLAPQIKDRARPSQGIGGYDKIGQGVVGLRRIDETCQLHGHDRPAFRFARAFIFRGLDCKNVRRFTQFLPLYRPVQSRATIAQYPIDATIADVLVAEPFAETTLLFGGDRRNREPVPEFLPIGQPIPCR